MPGEAAPEVPERRAPSWWRRWRLRILINLYGPFFGAGIRVVRIAPDLSAFDVRMRLNLWNRNYVGTHFGGSLYAMCDPFFMVILIEQLGRDYVVWDRSATIRFLRPGRGTVTARFEIAPEEAARIRALADSHRKVEPVFTAKVLDHEGQTVAEVEKVLYVRRKDRLETVRKTRSGKSIEPGSTREHV